MERRHAEDQLVDPETYEVRANGELLVCEPAGVLPLAQRYFLFSGTFPSSPPLTAPAETAPAVFVDDWIVWQLADSAFPTGGFAHSGGLESAWQNGEVRDTADLEEFIKAAAVQTIHGVLGFMLATHARPERLAECDAGCGAFITNHVATRASRLLGRALLNSVRNAFGIAVSEAEAIPEFGHLAPVFGAVTRQLNIPRDRAAHVFIFWHVRGWLGSAVRLGIIGPGEAQSLQFRLRDFIGERVARALMADPAALFQTAPLLEIWQGAQDRVYSRLFQS